MYQCLNCSKINNYNIFCKECFQIGKLEIEKKIYDYNNNKNKFKNECYIGESINKYCTITK